MSQFKSIASAHNIDAQLSKSVSSSDFRQKETKQKVEKEKRRATNLKNTK